MSRRGALILLALVLAAASGAAQEDFYREGNRLYREGDYQGALDAYTSILDAGYESGDLYFNVANAYFKLGDLGRAILYYERARRLAPRDEDVLANLTLARTLTVDEVEARPRFWVLALWDWWVGSLPRTVLIWVVAVSYASAMAGLLVILLRRDAPGALWGRRVAVAGGLLTLVLGFNLTLRELGLGRPVEAVVMVDAAPVRSAPAPDDESPLFTVHEGTKVRIERSSEDWAEVVLEDGRVGWLEASALETI